MTEGLGGVQAPTHSTNPELAPLTKAPGKNSFAWGSGAAPVGGVEPLGLGI